MTMARTLVWLRNRPVGVKLTVILVGVALFVALVLSFILGQMTKGHFFAAAHDHLEKEVQYMAIRLAQVMSHPGDSEQAVAALPGLAQGILSQDQPDQPYCLFLLGEGCDGPLTVLGRQDWLPGPVLQAEIAQRGRGWRRLLLDGEPGVAVYHELGGGLVLALTARPEDIFGPTWASLRTSTWVVTLLLSVIVAFFAVWVARSELGAPLRRLTEEAERAAGGDLSPPTALAGRQDELGRLSRALHSMTLTAKRMVAEASVSQRRFQQLFVETRDAAFIIDGQGRIEVVNPAGLRMFGYESPDQMRGLASTEELFADPGQRARYLAALQAKGYVQDFLATMRRRPDETFEALITATLRGEGEARFGLVRDVTATLKAQQALAESERRHRRLTENAPDIIYRWSIAAGAFDYISPAVRTVTGYGPEEVVDSTGIIWAVTHPDFKEAVANHWRAVLKGEGSAVSEQEFKIVAKSGQTRWLRERSILVRDDQGRPTALEGIATDVTERVQLAEAAERGRRMVEATLQGLPAPVMVVNRYHRVIHWNRAMEKLTRVRAQEIVGTDRQWQPFYAQPRPVLADLIVDGDRESVRDYYGRLGMKESAFINGGVEGESYFPDLAGRERHLYFLAAPITGDDGQVVAAVETLVDLTDKRRLEEELRRLTVTDELTGLYNHRFFFATLARELESAKRFGQPLCLIMADLDEFKAFNDRHGHLAGDRVLAACGRALKNLVRSTDLACRYGGEEFAVLLPRTDEAEALAVAERVRLGIGELSLDEGVAPAGSISASVGVAVFTPGMPAEELVSRADTAMYEAKNLGKNRVVRHRPEGGLEQVS
jgi:diguanylate cyclase (GGDEF)-like protein/PAS domain S-box-containing protein